jgi:hypothetical protein
MPVNTRRARPTATLAAVALASVLVSGCGGSSGATGGGAGKQTAGEFIREVTTRFSLGQSGRLWDTLHPVDQTVVSRARYMTCARNSGFELKTFKVLQTYPDTVDLAGKATPSTAVSVRTTSEDGVTTVTVHAVSVNGAWRWILSPADYAVYKQGKCPSA